MEENNQVAVVANALPILQSLPEQLTKHQASISNAENALTALLDMLPNGIKTAEQDEAAMNLLVKINKTVEKLQEARKPGTQMMTLIAKSFTELEGKLDIKKSGTLPERLQTLRNNYVTWLANEKKRIAAEDELKKNRDIEAGTLRADMVQYINSLLNNWLFKRKNDMENSFAAITLENYEEKSSAINRLVTMTNMEKVNEVLLPFRVKDWPYKYITEGACIAIKETVYKNFDYEPFLAMYRHEFIEMKQKFIDRLPSKKQELDQAEQNRLEQIRLKEAHAREQDALKKEQIRIQQEQAQLAEQKADQDRLERLAEEQRKNDEALLKKQETDRQAAEMTKTAATAQSLFGQSVSATLLEKEPQAKSGYDIEVKSAAGWSLIFNFWFMNAGIKLEADKFESVKLGTMKTFCEKEALKNGNFIESEFLTYKETTTAVNKAAKK